MLLAPVHALHTSTPPPPAEDAATTTVTATLSMHGGGGSATLVLTPQRQEDQPRDEILTLRRPASREGEAADSSGSSAAVDDAKVQDKKVLAADTAAAAFVAPIPAKPKRARSVSALMDIGAVSIPTARLLPGGAGGRGKGHVVYDIHVKPMGRRDDWTVHRRYSNFLQLHEALLLLPTTAPPAPLPPKRWWPLSGTSPEFIEARRAALEAYLQAALRDETLRKSRDLRIFLGLGGAFGVGHAWGSSGSISITSSTSSTPVPVPAPGGGVDQPQEQQAQAHTQAHTLFQFPYGGGSFAGDRGGDSGRLRKYGSRSSSLSSLRYAEPQPQPRKQKEELDVNDEGAHEVLSATCAVM